MQFLRRRHHGTTPSPLLPLATSAIIGGANEQTQHPVHSVNDPSALVSRKGQRVKKCTITVVLIFAAFWTPRFVGIVTGRIDGDSNTYMYNKQDRTNPNTLDIRAWTIVPGPPDRPAIVMLTDGSSKHNKFHAESIEEKVDYARNHNYTLVCGSSSLDKHRSTKWSKLKIIYRVLRETPHSIIFWLDVDTIIWDRQRTIEGFFPSDSAVSIVAQLDLHRSMKSKYFNGGVLIIRKTDWIMDILKRAYRQWKISLFQGIYYFNEDQEAMNLVMAKSDADEAASSRAGEVSRLDTHLDLKRYGQLWTLGKDRKLNPFILHFPNCVEGRCAPEYLDLYRQAMGMKQISTRSRSSYGLGTKIETM